MSEFVGKVAKKFFGKGPKSEHGTIYLETEQGQYVLRRQGGNPFYDPELHKLVGKNIQCSGVIDDYRLTVSDWKEVDETGGKSRFKALNSTYDFAVAFLSFALDLASCTFQ